MQQAASPSPASSSSATGFAALLSTFLKSVPESADHPEPGTGTVARENDGGDGLADDVAILSYERALRSHARYRPPALDDQMPTKAAAPAARDAKTTEGAPVSACRTSNSARQSLKSASVTVRLSSAEYEQLHQRAAEAGLTVSAYLRSCTFEVESLRAQVKETLALLRSATDSAAALPAAATPEQGRSWVKSLRLGWPRR
jgi:hypothetical protein